MNTVLKQYQISDEGLVFYQPDPTNPMPGKAVAQIKKGEKILEPAFDILPGDLPESVDEVAIKAGVKTHIEDVLESLVKLADETDIESPAKDIAALLYEALGILPRADLEDLISGIDEAGRASLRTRRVRLGPVLVFLPLLNKPAAIKLRAVLWSLWNDKKLPAFMPKEGVTSLTVETDNVDPLYFRAIGYPLYGPRAVRVDMLDRIICAVYDSAKDGKFKAEHKMAEWMGCSIADLYAVLEAMGHKKIHDPADEVKAEEEKVAEEKGEAKTPEVKEAPEAETVVEKKPEEKTEEKPEVKEAAKEENKEPVAKPELATFQLRRGRAYSKPYQKKEFKNTKDKKPYKAKGKKNFKDNKRKPKPSQPRVHSARAAPSAENNPFAALQSLKSQGKE